jgi:hypothetical protein
MTRKRTTFLNECRKFFPGCTETEARDLMWNATAFPSAPIEHCRKQLREAAQEGGGTPDGAIAWAYEETKRVMREMNAREGMANANDSS